ncbi:hypothetical protein HWC21_gp142 [Vibrio phage VAP7]|uniref:Uncharacterized protein n=1 Tax=Vibrio phage VAP7 TaxID=2584487 RepID=A0A4Y5TVB6_9CAUD|nr:hypothetical protein HWC21_gp142 [Vibrio phage VAP7]QDB73324.1 hypothetical protein [Vibrio phage VAP7]
MNHKALVEGHPDLKRPIRTSGVIVNENTEGYEEFIRVRNKQQERDDKTNKLEAQVEQLLRLLAAKDG